MNKTFFKACVPFVIGISLSATYQTAHAVIIPTDQVAENQQLPSDREKVKTFLDRAGVQAKLQTFGVSGILAKQRVDALSDQEIAMLAEKIDSLPAGGTLSNNDLILILLVVILAVLVL
jgi:hypothetical protein